MFPKKTMIQPGVGYTYTNGPGGMSLVIDEQAGVQPHPFKVFCVKGATGCIVRVTPGTINSIEPTLGGTVLSASPPPTVNIGSASSYTPEYIYLKMPVAASGTPPAWPDGPIIDNQSSLQTSDDTVAYLLLAVVDKSTGGVTQYVSGSQYGERLKCGANPAAYYFGIV